MRLQKDREQKQTDTADTAEAVLIPRLLAGDGEAMRAVYRLYYLRLLYFTTKVTGSKTKGEDIVQEALMNFWINVRDRQIRPENVQRYLFRMVRNRCINHLQYEQRIAENNGAAIEEYHAQL